MCHTAGEAGGVVGRQGWAGEVTRARETARESRAGEVEWAPGKVGGAPAKECDRTCDLGGRKCDLARRKV